MPVPRGATDEGERPACRDADLLAHEIDPRDELRDRVLDLEAAVHLDEVRLALGAEQELERPRALVADESAGTRDGRLELLAGLRRERRGGRLLHELLVTALDRALALAEREHAALRVAEHLDLDVPGRGDHLLEVERAVAEGGLRLRRRGGERVVETGRVVDAAASPSRRLLRSP